MDARQWTPVQDWPSPMEGQRLAAQQDMAMARSPLGRRAETAVPARDDRRSAVGVCGTRPETRVRSRPGRRW